jgi:hypothetical protein
MIDINPFPNNIAAEMTDQFVQNASTTAPVPAKDRRLDKTGRNRQKLFSGLVFRIKQTMHMDNEITHVGVVDGRLRLRLPGGQSRRVIRKDTNDIKVLEIAELDLIETFQFTAEHEVQQLLLFT